MLMAACYFTSTGHKLVLEPLPVRDNGDEDLVALTQRIASGLEHLIRSAPEQWHLLQPNWPSDRVAIGQTNS